MSIHWQYLCIFLTKQEYLVPQEYVQIMRESMLNKCPVSSYDQVCEVFKKELGETPDKVCTIYLIFTHLLGNSFILHLHTNKSRNYLQVIMVLMRFMQKFSCWVFLVILLFPMETYALADVLVYFTCRFLKSLILFL